MNAKIYDEGNLEVQTDYEVTIKINQEWFEFLGELSKHNDGFVWVEVKSNG